MSWSESKVVPDLVNRGQNSWGSFKHKMLPQSVRFLKRLKTDVAFTLAISVVKFTKGFSNRFVNAPYPP